MSVLLNRLPLINDVLDGLRTGASTVGISPKALAPPIAVAIDALLHLVHVPLSHEVVLLIAGTVAAYLLPPGRVAAAVPGAVHPDEVGPASDSLLKLPDEIASTIENATAATGQAVGQAGDVLEAGSDVAGVTVTGVGQSVGAATRGITGLLGKLIARHPKP